jgi:hypothetical protein
MLPELGATTHAQSGEHVAPNSGNTVRQRRSAAV